MTELGLPVPRGYVAHGDFFLPSGHVAMRQLLALADRPTAVFAAGDEMAVGALHAISDAGLDVPGDISVVGYDDVEVAALVRPALTTVTQDYLAMGRAAVEVLADLIAAGPSTPDAAGRPPLATPRLLPGHLIVRESSAPPRR
jgi:LacI family transcriptional regulator